MKTNPTNANTMAARTLRTLRIIANVAGVRSGVNGGEGQNRTVDTTIFSRMLYQLSYLATRTADGRTAIITINRRAAQRGGGATGPKEQWRVQKDPPYI
jgi:hypothetical protein